MAALLGPVRRRAQVAATEFVIGATFVALGAQTRNILLGLLIGNLLAIASWTLITAPISTQTRLSLYTYLDKIAGSTMTKLYNWANVVIFTVISFLRVEAVLGDLAEREAFTAHYARMVEAHYANPDIAQHMQALLSERPYRGVPALRRARVARALGRLIPHRPSRTEN